MRRAVAVFHSEKKGVKKYLKFKTQVELYTLGFKKTSVQVEGSNQAFYSSKSKISSGFVHFPEVANMNRFTNTGHLPFKV